MADLKPCPFCGGPAELDSFRPFLALGTGKRGSGISVYCVGECSAEMMLCRGDDIPGLSVEMVVDMWNRRATADGVPVPHPFKEWFGGDVVARPYCGSCGRLRNDPLHTDGVGGADHG